MSADRRSRWRHLALAAGLALLAGLVAPVAGIGDRIANAQAGDEICPKNAGGFPLKTTSAWSPTDDFSSVSCAYDNTHKPRNQTHFSAEVFWHDAAAVDADEAEMDTRFCDRGDAGDAARLFYEGPTHAFDLSRIGERRIYTRYAWGRPDKKAAARKLARTLMRAVQGSATACPGTTAGDASGDGSATSDGTADGTTEIVLSGQRLRDLRRAGGVGAVLSLEGDERHGLVLTDAAGNVVAEDDLLGSRGRVVEMGVSLVGEDGVEVVSVTVELLPAESAPDPDLDEGAIEPDDDEDETDLAEEADQADPVDGEGATDPVADTDAADPVDDTDAADPTAADPTAADPIGPGTGTDPVDPGLPDPTAVADGPIGAIADRVRAELDDITGRGDGSVIVGSDEIGMAAAAAGGLVASVRPRAGKIEVTLVSSKFPRLFLYPQVDPASGEVRVVTKVEPPGDFGFVEIPIDPSLLPGVGSALERGLEALNAELRRRAVRPTGIVINEHGVLVDFEASP